MTYQNDDNLVFSDPDKSDAAGPHVNDNIVDQVNLTTKVITNKEAEPTSTPIPHPNDTLDLQDKWSRDKHILLVNILGEPRASIEPKRVIEALKEEGWVIAMQ
ncbi:hypothetical protein Tco_0969077 [Tanacetum coccineum]